MCDGQDTINNSCFIRVTLIESVIFSQCQTPNNSLIIGLQWTQSISIALQGVTIDI